MESSSALDRFNELPPDEAGRRLMACFAHRPWAFAVQAGRPYAGAELLFSAADSAWAGLTDADWRAVFDSHPRIGEGGGHSPEASNQEQSRAAESSRETRAALAEENRAYEARFGHVFLIAAAGRSGEEILAELRRRMANNRHDEFEEVKAELRKIGRMRLERMLSE